METAWHIVQNIQIYHRSNTGLIKDMILVELPSSWGLIFICTLINQPWLPMKFDWRDGNEGCETTYLNWTAEATHVIR